MADKRKVFKLIDLFCGAGGMSLGFVDPRFCGGFECILAVDNDKAAIKAEAANFGRRTIYGNIEDWFAENPRFHKADVVIGRPPCQEFSLLNKKRTGDLRCPLWERAEDPPPALDSPL